MDKIEDLKKTTKITITPSITEKTRKHIFEGEINPQGKATGVHHVEAIVNGKSRIISGTRIEGPNGTCKEKVEVQDANGNWIAKTANMGYSTFFPDNWSKRKVMEEVTHAFNNRIKVTGTSNEWKGFSRDGVEIRMYLNNNNGIISAFPKDFTP